MKAIETIWNGYRFRSRTEARWAVFFSSMGWHYVYEPEGYHLTNGSLYLPDFYLPDCDAFCEVKGTKFTDDEKEKCRLLSTLDFGAKYDWEKNRFATVIMLDGPPEEKEYDAYQGGKSICSIVLCNGKYSPFYYGQFDDYFDCTSRAVHASRAARFEHGETPHI